MSSFKGRQQANREIVEMIASIVEAFPDQRFGQILSNIGINNRIISKEDYTVPPVIEDNVHEESTVTLARVWETLKLNSEES